MIVSNPPYVTRGEIPGLAQDVAGYEPHLALDGGDDGLDVVRRLVAETERYLAPSGALLFEVGAGQADAVCALLRERAAMCQVCSHRDLGGVLRVVEAHLAS